MTRKDLPQFVQMELNEKVEKLFEYIKQLEEEIKTLREENSRLKGLSPKPNLKPATSPLNPLDPQKSKPRGGSKPGARRGKTDQLEIHHTEMIQPLGEIPAGSVFKGYQEYVVQDLVISSENTLYQLARWVTPDGKPLMGELPKAIEGHFGSQLRAYILYQHTQCRVTEPLLLEQLHEFGVDISSGQLHVILTQDHDAFHDEKQEILKVGLEVSSFIQTDDTGARHDGKNGYCNVICNELFAYFETTESKSRINFLEILRGQATSYVWSEDAIVYATAMKLPASSLQAFELDTHFSNRDIFEEYLKAKNIHQEQHVRIITEAALIGSLLAHGFNPNLVILSDDAGQFNVFLHALCWIHAERLIKKLCPINSDQVKAIESVRSQIWDFYERLTAYKADPTHARAAELSDEFDAVFSQNTCFAMLNAQLKRLLKNKPELLVVLSRPEVPLHNNQSESDIREKVQRRKISVTFSDAGRKCRDTFSSLKKTCRKNDISFWKFLVDRISGTNQLARLSQVIRLRAGPCLT